MTSENRKELVRKACRAVYDRHVEDTVDSVIEVAIDIALEEAAKVAEYSTERQYTGKSVAQEIADAIRALKGKSVPPYPQDLETSRIDNPKG